MRTVEQGLTFQEAEEAFARYHVDFTEDKYIALGLRNIHDDQYTNLALILSDQCKHTTKIAVFGDDANTVFKDASLAVLFSNSWRKAMRICPSVTGRQRFLKGWSGSKNRIIRRKL